MTTGNLSLNIDVNITGTTLTLNTGVKQTGIMNVITGNLAGRIITSGAGARGFITIG